MLSVLEKTIHARKWPIKAQEIPYSSGEKKKPRNRLKMALYAKVKSIYFETQWEPFV